MIKRWLMVLLAALTLTGSLAACGDNGSSGGTNTSSSSKPAY